MSETERQYMRDELRLYIGQAIVKAFEAEVVL